MPKITATPLLLLSCALFQPVGAQPQVSVIRAQAPAVPVSVFGGESIRVPVMLDGIGSCEQVVTRLYQTATMLQAPLSDWAPLQCHSVFAASGRQAARADIEVAVPHVDAEIDLELRFARCAMPGEDCDEFGHVPISALPADLLDPLDQWAVDHVLQVHDSHGDLTGFLEIHDIDYLSAGAILPRDVEVVSLIVEDDSLDQAVLSDYQRAGAVVLFREKPDAVPLVMQKDTTDGRLIDVRLPVVSRLSSDPAAVKLFLDIFLMTQSHELSL